MKYSIIHPNGSFEAENLGIEEVYDKYLTLISLGIGYRCVESDSGKSAIIREVKGTLVNILEENRKEENEDDTCYY